MSMIPARDPDFVNDSGVKWWRLVDFESDLHKTQGMNNYMLFLTKHPDQTLSYVIIDAVSNQIKHVRENIQPTLDSVESFIAESMVRMLAGKEIDDVEVDFLVIPRDILKRLLINHGVSEDATKSSFSASRAVTASSEMLSRSLSSSMELLKSRMPLNRLHGTFVSNHVESLTAEVCMLQDSNMRYRRVVEEIAALVLPPGTYADIHGNPERVIEATRLIREQWFQTLKTIDPNGIEHENRG